MNFNFAFCLQIKMNRFLGAGMWWKLMCCCSVGEEGTEGTFGCWGVWNGIVFGAAGRVRYGKLLG